MKINILLFTEIMASLLKSGLSLQDSLSLAQSILTRSSDKKFCNMLYKGISEGNVLSDELSIYRKNFGSLYISFIKIGEETGRLSDVFEKLSEYLKAKKESRSRLLQNLIYPVLVLATAILVIFVIITFVFPRLEGIFEAFGELSSELEYKVIKLEKSMRLSGFIVVSFIFIIGILIIGYKFIKQIKTYLDYFLMKLPVISKLISYSQTYDFSFSMKLLCSAYYPFDKAIYLSSNVISNDCYKDAVLAVHENIVNGESIGKSFELHKFFPEYFVSWIKIAEKNGNLSDSFSHIYEYFKRETDNFGSKVSTALEPVFILVTGIIVIIIIAQFVIPVFNLVGTL